ncbi:MAG: hypothetical protein [Chaetfec virus UA24_2292]|nr:MAG: hypothetical protein [Chaetfec virus UA24_2292]
MNSVSFFVMLALSALFLYPFYKLIFAVIDWLKRH